MPLARHVVHARPTDHAASPRPAQLRRTDTQTGDVTQVLVPCGHTLASVCPACADRAKALRAAQCREGWHLDTEPVMAPDKPDDEQCMWIEHRADTQRSRDHADADADMRELDELA